MDVPSKVLGLVAACRDRKNGPPGVLDGGGEDEGPGRFGDGYGRVSAHELLHVLVRQQVE
jgi:hypothetical protein